MMAQARHHVDNVRTRVTARAGGKEKKKKKVFLSFDLMQERRRSPKNFEWIVIVQETAPETFSQAIKPHAISGTFFTVQP